jgi:nitrate reductase alpha subunit
VRTPAGFAEVSPGYSDHTKFADDWLPAAPGTDGALAMAMGHVILPEFYRDRHVPYFRNYCTSFTDLPFPVRLRPGEAGGRWLPDKFLTAGDLGQDIPDAAFKTRGVGHRVRPPGGARRLGGPGGAGCSGRLVCCHSWRPIVA